MFRLPQARFDGSPAPPGMTCVQHGPYRESRRGTEEDKWLDHLKLREREMVGQERLCERVPKEGQSLHHSDQATAKAEVGQLPPRIKVRDLLRSPCVDVPAGPKPDGPRKPQREQAEQAKGGRHCCVAQQEHAWVERQEGDQQPNRNRQQRKRAEDIDSMLAYPQ